MSSHSPTAEEQFVIYAERLRHEINTAYTHYEIAKSLREFRHTRPSEYSEAITFFQVTTNANLFAAVMTISRGFIDKSDDCLQLEGFFELVKGNLKGSVPKVVEKGIGMSYPIGKPNNQKGRTCRWRKDTTRDRN